MAGYKYTYAELNKIFSAATGKTLGQVDKNHVFDKTIDKPKITGIAGDVIEHSVLGYPADTESKPDLLVDGDAVELKCTGLKIKKTKKGNDRKDTITAKEPMSITAVAPEKIQHETFDDSALWHKLEHLLLVYYLYDADKTVKAAEYAKFPIQGYQFHEFSAEDKDVIENDWSVVADFIRNVNNENLDIDEEYPKISKLRTKMMYMDTAPKWPHRPRFRLKRKFVDTIVQKHFGVNFEPLTGSNNFNNYQELDNRLHNLTQQYQGQTMLELAQELGVVKKEDTKVSKSMAEQILVKMFGGKVKKLRKIETFAKMDLIPKTLVLTPKGGRTEDTKFDTIDFDEWCNPDTAFEDSDVYSFFADKTMLFSIFQEVGDNCPLEKTIFKGFKRISFDDQFIQTEVKPTWLKIRELVNGKKLTVTKLFDKHGNPLMNKNKNQKEAINFPKSSEYNVFLRGTGRDSNDKPLVLNGLRMYNQQFWIKGKLMVKMLDEIEYI